MMAVGNSLIRRLDKPAIPWSVVIRVFLGAYFIYAGYNKVVDPAAFLKAIRLYGVFPEDPAIFINATAIILPWLEIVCGAALVLGLFRRGAGLLIALMLCVFTPVILLQALAVMGEEGISFFAVEFDCGCGTGDDIIWIKLCKNTGLFVLALFTVLSQSTRYSVAALLERRRPSTAHCRECGAALSASANELCDRCRERSVVPTPPLPETADCRPVEESAA